MGNARRIAAVWFGVCLFAALPLAAQDLATPVTTVTQKETPKTDDPNFPAKGDDFYWVCELRACGDYVVTIGRNNWLCVFHRDRQTAALKFASSCSLGYNQWDWFLLDTKELPNQDGAVYVGVKGKLYWLTLDHATGKLASQGELSAAVDGVSSITVSPDGGKLYVAGSAKFATFTLDPKTGKPTELTQSALEGAHLIAGKGGMLAPNGNLFYACGGNEVFAIAIDPQTGKATVKSKEKVEGAGTNKWSQPALSPDGKFLYVPLATAFAVFACNSETGVLTSQPDQKLGDITGVLEMCFAPDGRSGYFVSQGEGVKGPASNCVGWFTRDPATGALTYVGRGPAKGGYTRVVLDPAAGNLFALVKLPGKLYSFKTPTFATANGK
ncbi:MAG: lactonase family protein [Planctomycetota bacterium]